MFADSFDPCLICGGPATGNNYGVWSCEGCKSFFRRCNQPNARRYVCPANNQCVSLTGSRDMCRACRYRTCLELGMKTTEKRKLDRLQRVQVTEFEEPISKRCTLYQCSQGAEVGLQFCSEVSSNCSTDLDRSPSQLSSMSDSTPFDDELDAEGAVPIFLSKCSVKLRNCHVMANKAITAEDQITLKIFTEAFLDVWNEKLKRYDKRIKKLLALYELNEIAAHCVIKEKWIHIVLVDMLEDSYDRPNDVAQLSYNVLFGISNVVDVQVKSLFTQFFALLHGMRKFKFTKQHFLALKAECLFQAFTDWKHHNLALDLLRLARDTLDFVLMQNDPEIASDISKRFEKGDMINRVLSEIQSLAKQFASHLQYAYPIYRQGADNLLSAYLMEGTSTDNRNVS
ncbi:hypothetical protein ACOME3_003823 [Neoechinorhynchus agilis]